MIYGGVVLLVDTRCNGHRSKLLDAVKKDYP
jgi:hypothetical protein